MIVRGALVSSQLTWKTEWQRSSLTLHQSWSTDSTSASRETSTHNAVKTCCFMTGTFHFFSTMALSYSLFILRCTVLLSALTFVCKEAKFYWRFGYEVQTLCPFVNEFFLPKAPAKKQMVHLKCFYYKHLWIICWFQIQSDVETLPYGVVYQ